MCKSNRASEITTTTTFLSECLELKKDDVVAPRDHMTRALSNRNFPFQNSHTTLTSFWNTKSHLNF